MEPLPGSSFQNDPVAGTSQPGVARCAVHPNVPATFCCNDCGGTFCATCGFDEEDGNIICTECMTSRMPPPVVPTIDSSLLPISPELAQQMADKHVKELFAMLASPADWASEALNAAKVELQRRNVGIPQPEDAIPPPIPKTPAVRAGVMCAQHPKVQSVQQCKRCGGFMCPTCDFSFPDDIHLCPTCVSKTEEGLSPRRKKFVIGSFALAAWSTLGMVCLVSGALSGLSSSEDDTAALGFALLLFVLGPTIAGLSLGISAKHSQMANPPSVWIAITWNAILFASFVVLMLIGLTKQ